MCGIKTPHHQRLILVSFFMSERINLLSIDIIKTNLDEYEINNDELINEIDSFDGLIKQKNLYEHHSAYSVHEDRLFPFGKTECDKFISCISDKVNKSLGKEMVMSEIWTITLEHGQSVAAHSHKSIEHINPLDYYSIVYFPSAPENSADLTFMVNACNTIDKNITFTPTSGTLFIFNSYILHMTNRHRNKDTKRISISANFHPQKRENVVMQDWSVYRAR